MDWIAWDPVKYFLADFSCWGGYLHPPYPFTEHHLVAFDALPYTLIKPLVKKYTIRGGGSNALYTAYDAVSDLMHN